MLTPEEQTLHVALLAHFARLLETGAPLEPSMQSLVRTLAAVLALEMDARGGEEALTRTVDPYARLLKTWTREAWLFATRRIQGQRN
jgi:hypothetical protein